MDLEHRRSAWRSPRCFRSAPVMLRDTARLRIGFRVRGDEGRAARQADDFGPAGKLLASLNGAVRYASCLPRDYKREKSERHGKRIDAELARNCDHAGEGMTGPGLR